MKRLVLWLAMYAGAFGPAFGILAQEPIVPPHDAPAAFEFACELGAYDCTDLPLPRIEWSDLYHAYGIFGGYDGADVIYMDTGVLRFADSVFVQSVLAHEITHYLDVQLGLTTLPYTPQNLCESEYRGWRAGNAYVVSHGRLDLASFDWHVRYGCFQ